MRIRGITRTMGYVLLTVVAIMLLSADSEAKTSSCAPSINVTTTFQDFNGSTAYYLHSDGLGPYSGTLNANVSDSIYCGELFLKLYSQSYRTLYINPDNPIDSSQPQPPPAGNYWQNVELASTCYDSNGNQVPMQNVTNGSGNCGMIVDFYWNGIKYKLSMGKTCSACPSVASPSGLVSVACNAVSSGGCVNWTFTPNLTASSTNAPMVANLFYYNPQGPHNLIFVGQYYLTFNFGVSYP